jgi:hypothetical protein
MRPGEKGASSSYAHSTQETVAIVIVTGVKSVRHMAIGEAEAISTCCKLGRRQEGERRAR